MQRRVRSHALPATSVTALVAVFFSVCFTKGVIGMKEFKKVRRRVLWRDGDFRMVRYLVIYFGHGDGSWGPDYWSDPTMYWQVQECVDHWPDGECDWITLWDVSRIPGWYRDDYLYADRAERGRITRRNAQLGREWLKKHKRLLASPPWQIKCEKTASPVHFVHRFD